MFPTDVNYHNCDNDFVNSFDLLKIKATQKEIIIKMETVETYMCVRYQIWKIVLFNYLLTAKYQCFFADNNNDICSNSKKLSCFRTRLYPTFDIYLVAKYCFLSKLIVKI